MKRIVLFVITNLAVMLVLSATLRILGVDRYITAQGLNLQALLVFSVVVGFTGAIISLLISKPMAKWSTGAQCWIRTPAQSARGLAARYRAPTGRSRRHRPSRSRHLRRRAERLRHRRVQERLAGRGIHRSAGKHDRRGIAAVLAHEVAHIANGDMVTLTLIQGVVNTFVVFLARVVGYFIDRVVLKNEARHGHRLLRHRAGL